MVAATTLWVGNTSDVEKGHASMIALADEYGGISAGGDNGIKGY